MAGVFSLKVKTHSLMQLASELLQEETAVANRVCDSCQAEIEIDALYYRALESGRVYCARCVD